MTRSDRLEIAPSEVASGAACQAIEIIRADVWRVLTRRRAVYDDLVLMASALPADACRMAELAQLQIVCVSL